MIHFPKNLLMVVLLIFFQVFKAKSSVCPVNESIDNNQESSYLQRFSNYINQMTCDKSLIPFELASDFTYEQRCQLIDDLNLLKKISFSSYGPLFVKTFSPSIPPSGAGQELYDWITQRIQKIYLMNDDHSVAINYGLCADTNACDKYYQRGDVGLDLKYFSKPYAIDRLIILIHEARHTDGHDFINGQEKSNIEYNSQHIDCNHLTVSLNETREKIQKTCDENLEGSIGASIIFLGNILENCNNCNSLIDIEEEELRNFYIRNEYNSNINNINIKNFSLAKIIQ